MDTRSRRIRPLLLVLLWAWAGCVALVLDLFLNVAAFDAIRPRAPLYTGMRGVAHAMVGEPLGHEAASPAPRPARTAEVRPVTDGVFLSARPSSRHPGGRPDARTPQGGKLRDDLLAAANSADEATRRAAVRSLARMFGPQASDALERIADDTAQPASVRELAANLAARTLDGRK